jgi:DNA-binding transcriptional LysR family regulator
MRHLYGFRCVDAVAKAGSIRKAAETMALTPSALNRRILAMEEELGVQIFERLPRGVRLSTAGELLIYHIRNQISDFERLQSQIADLTGVRRGHVSIACSQALLPYFLPEQIEIYRTEHPGVSFDVVVRDREAAEAALLDYSADVAMIFEPVRLLDCQSLLIVKQPIHAVVRARHPLARHKTLRLEQIARYPIAMPTRPYGVRTLIDRAAARMNQKIEPTIQSDSFEFIRHIVEHGDAVGFQIGIGLPPPTRPNKRITYRPIDERDVPAGRLHLAQLKGRSLPVAAARFADQLQTACTDMFEAV